MGMIRTRSDVDAEKVRRRVCHDYGLDLPYDDEKKIDSLFDAMPFPPWILIGFYILTVGMQMLVNFRTPDTAEYSFVMLTTVTGFMVTWVIARSTYQHFYSRERQRDNLVILALANKLERLQSTDSRGVALAMSARSLYRNMRLDIAADGETKALVDVELAQALKQEIDDFLRGQLDKEE